jgi:hypothetical protein
MSYKDKTFEIDGEQIKFENKTHNLFLPIIIAILSTTLFFNNHGFISFLCGFLGMALGLTIAFRVFIRLYWKSIINLSDISFVELKSWDSDIDKMRNFWGIPKFRYHFPTGFDKKSNSKVIFVHRNKEKLAIGFAPTNCIATISAFQEKGIKVVESN